MSYQNKYPNPNTDPYKDDLKERVQNLKAEVKGNINDMKDKFKDDHHDIKNQSSSSYRAESENLKQSSSSNTYNTNQRVNENMYKMPKIETVKTFPTSAIRANPIVIGGLILLGIGGYYYYKNHQPKMAVFKESVPTIAVVNKTGEPKYNLK